MVAVKTGLAPPPMMPQQPMNMMPPPMPVPAINQPMPMQQGAAPVPVNARRRKRFGDSLETMLSRPPMVASDQMGDMNVFTGQMMNTAARRPVVQQMRGGGNVRQMYRDAYSSPAFAAAQSAASQRNPGRTGAMTHSQLMDKIRGGSSPNDDKPPPDITGSFSDPSSREDYTPTSAELNQQLLDMGAPDKRFDVVPNATKKIYGGMGDLDQRDDQTSTLNAINASIAAANRRAAGGFSDVEMAPGTGGLSSVPSIPSTPVGSGMNPSNVYVDPLDPFGGPGPDILIPSMQFGAQPAGALPGMSFGQQPVGALPADPNTFISDVFETPSIEQMVKNDGIGGGRDPLDLGIGEEIVRPKIRPEGGGEEQDDRGFVEKFKDDARKFGSSLVKDLQMGIAAGLFGSRATRFQRLIDAGYSAAEANDFLDRSEDTMKKMMDKQAQQSAQDDDSPMSTSVVDPCPPGFKLDPVSGICVPIEEAEEEGPSLDLNRTRDDEFNELDDIMKRIVKPVDETDNVRTMQAGGSVGLNRVADNFLAAMGG